MRAAAGKCPFPHDTSTAASAPMPAAGKCPVDHGQNGQAASDLRTAEPVASALQHEEQEVGHSEAPQARQGKCPVDHSTAAKAAAKQAEPAQQQGGRCPFGYDTPSNEPALTDKHCVLCRSLVYDCVAAQPCQHRYCRECIARFHDCPLCGRDIDSLESDAACQGTVDDFIDRHAHQQVPNGHANGSLNEVQTPAAFFLELGLTSMAGKNYSAAVARLERCRQLLLEEPGADARPFAKLGAVCGSQGDCSMQLGQMQEASAHYQESIDHLSRAPEPNTEAQQALTVSLNKLGDLAYWQGDVQAARKTYHEAFLVRQKLLDGCSQAGDSSEHAGLTVDVGVSLGKLMDADKVLGDTAAARQWQSQAKELLSNMDAAVSKCGPVVQHKYSALQKLLQADV